MSIVLSCFWTTLREAFLIYAQIKNRTYHIIWRKKLDPNRIVELQRIWLPTHSKIFSTHLQPTENGAMFSTRIIFAIGNVLHAQSHCTVPGYLEGNLLHQQTELYTRKGQLSGDLQQIRFIALRPRLAFNRAIQ